MGDGAQREFLTASVAGVTCIYTSDALPVLAGCGYAECPERAIAVTVHILRGSCGGDAGDAGAVALWCRKHFEEVTKDYDAETSDFAAGIPPSQSCGGS